MCFTACMAACLYAAELKKTYRCYGHFYRLKIRGVDPLLCRSVLHITSLSRDAVGAGMGADDLFSDSSVSGAVPDAVVIMMNPGSSRPIEDGDTDSLLKMPLTADFEKPLVLTQPDNTQYQIMRVMAARGWTYVRILNLSDIRDPKSPSFIARTRALARRSGGAVHSMFCDARAEERAAMLKRKRGAPLILGWGQDAGLVPMANQGMRCIEGQPIVTVPASDDPVLTAHPSPMMQKAKEAWLADILERLEA